jgi:hypothetical protein
MAAVTAAQCALERRQPVPHAEHGATQHGAFAALAQPGDHTRAEGAPEMQLLALLAGAEEGGR